MANTTPTLLNINAPDDSAHVRCVGALEPCAEIMAFDVRELYTLNRVYPIGRLSSHIGYVAETVLERLAAG